MFAYGEDGRGSLSLLEMMFKDLTFDIIDILLKALIYFLMVFAVKKKKIYRKVGKLPTNYEVVEQWNNGNMKILYTAKYI